jgi:ribonuclease HI
MQSIATGIPQGSPVSPILFLIYIRDICKQRQGSFSLSYIDDYCIATTSTSEKKNCKHLDIAIKQLVKEGKESAIEFDASKTELLHISSKRQQTQESICIRGESFAPSKVVRWLGFYLDPKLSFKNHIERRISLARQALFRINRLGNTQRGLSMQANRQLYISCITTVADYGAQLWWGIRRNTLLKTYKTLQNAALKQILGAFTGSPTLAMEIEASILPVKLRIDKLCNSYAIRLLAFNKLHPIKLAIAEHTQDELATESSYNSNNSTLSRLQPTTQLETLVARIKGFKHSNKFEKISYLWAKPWDKPISAFATLAISIASKQDTAKQHTTLLHNLATQELETPLLFYTDGSKKDSQTAAGYCLLQLEEPGQKQRYTKATNLNLGEHMEIMDAELFAIYKALQSIPYAEGKQIYIFVDSQAALKRLDKVSTTGGQQCVHAIAQLCKKLQQQNNTLYFSWVPGHKDVIGNEHADKLAKAGLKRKASKEAYTSLSNLRRQLKAKTLQEWRTLWFTAKDQHKGKQYEQNTKGAPQITLKANMLSYPRKIQSAYYQLKLGKGFFKSHSKAIGKDREGKCFGNCRVLQTPRHLVLHCKHYKNERKEMEKALGSRLSLSKLFNTKKGKEAILAFLQTTQIATLPWLLQAGDLDLLVNLAPL